MTYKEILNKTRIVGDFLVETPMLAIIKGSKDGICEISEARRLTEQEIKQYVWHLANFLIDGHSNPYTLTNGEKSLTLTLTDANQREKDYVNEQKSKEEKK